MQFEIVNKKNAETYRRIFTRYGARPEEAVMAGNSLRSDILPALEAGAGPCIFRMSSNGRTNAPRRRMGSSGSRRWGRGRSCQGGWMG